MIFELVSDFSYKNPKMVNYRTVDLASSHQLLSVARKKEELHPWIPIESLDMTQSKQGGS